MWCSICNNLPSVISQFGVNYCAVCMEFMDMVEQQCRFCEAILTEDAYVVNLLDEGEAKVCPNCYDNLSSYLVEANYE